MTSKQDRYILWHTFIYELKHLYEHESKHLSGTLWCTHGTTRGKRSTSRQPRCSHSYVTSTLALATRSKLVATSEQRKRCTNNSATQVLAVSHELQSEPQTSYTAVLPNPARNLSILAVQVKRFIIEEVNIGSKNINFVSSQDATISLQWLPPVNSLLTEYNIRYKPVVSPKKRFHHKEYF